MGTFASRQVVLLPFPFSDLTANKLRPALILGNPYADPTAIRIAETDFSEGGLQRVSFARASKLFTAHESLFQRAVGQLKPDCHAQIVQVIVEMLQAGQQRLTPAG